jgi:ABC-type bacteriocin/lantibiotic exporter with double-glycine peptidase domain
VAGLCVLVPVLALGLVPTVPARPPVLASVPLQIAATLRVAELRAGGARVTAMPAWQRQQAANDCALAVVRQLHRHARLLPPHRDSLARLLDLGPRGVSLAALATALRALGWPARVVRDSTALAPPAIALLHPGHFVLLLRRHAGDMEYFDPLVGLVRQPLSQYAVHWTGKGVQLSTRDN